MPYPIVHLNELLALGAACGAGLLAQSSVVDGVPFAKEFLGLGSTGAVIGLLIYLLMRAQAREEAAQKLAKEERDKLMDQARNERKETSDAVNRALERHGEGLGRIADALIELKK